MKAMAARVSLIRLLMVLVVGELPAIVLGAPRAETLPSSGVEYEVPEGFAMSPKRASRPDGGTVAFLVPKLWCAADARREIAAALRLGAFDARGRLLWDAKAAGTVEIKEMFVQRDGAVIVWGWHLEKTEVSPRSAILFRIGRSGLDSSFQALTPTDLGHLRLTSVRLASDDGIEIEGSFTSVRGQPRAGRARLRPDGSLDD